MSTTNTKKYAPAILVNPMYNPGITEIPEIYNREVVICIKDLPPTDLPESSFNVYVDGGEPTVNCHPIEDIKQRKDLDLILTKSKDLKENSPCPSIVFPFGSCWTENKKEKEFGVSFLMTCPEGLDGYDLRHKLWSQKDNIKIPNHFYNSSRRPINSDAPKIGENKDKLFDVMFSIIIENTKEPYYFTEKLIDCLQSKTVPIYYGCSEPEKFFDANGIISVNSEQEIIDICNSLTEEDYKKRKTSILNNYEISKEYARDYPKRIFETIEKYLQQT